MSEFLVLGLYAEGSTDYSFLPSIIRRTAEQILTKHEQFDSKPRIEHITLTKGSHRKREDCILQAAKEALYCQVLIVHSDADHPTAEKAKNERFIPGFTLVQHCNEALCKHLLPIIPVQAIEAWMLADYQLLLSEIGTSVTVQNLNIPRRAKLVEAIANPKQRMKEAVHKAFVARSRRRQEVDIVSLYEVIGEHINLDRLSQVPSYKQFCQDLTATLKSLNVLQ